MTRRVQKKKVLHRVALVALVFVVLVHHHPDGRHRGAFDSSVQNQTLPRSVLGSFVHDDDAVWSRRTADGWMIGCLIWVDTEEKFSLIEKTTLPLNDGS
jgi:hypothetical protein